MQPGLFFFPLYHTNKAVKDFNVLLTLAVYDRAFSDLDMMKYFIVHGGILLIAAGKLHNRRVVVRF